MENELGNNSFPFDHTQFSVDGIFKMRILGGPFYKRGKARERKNPLVQGTVVITPSNKTTFYFYLCLFGLIDIKLVFYAQPKKSDWGLN